MLFILSQLSISDTQHKTLKSTELSPKLSKRISGAGILITSLFASIIVLKMPFTFSISVQ
jgi:hypothetical protein